MSSAFHTSPHPTSFGSTPATAAGPFGTVNTAGFGSAAGLTPGHFQHPHTTTPHRHHQLQQELQQCLAQCNRHFRLGGALAAQRDPHHVEALRQQQQLQQHQVRQGNPGFLGGGKPHGKRRRRRRRKTKRKRKRRRKTRKKRRRRRRR